MTSTKIQSLMADVNLWIVNLRKFSDKSPYSREEVEEQLKKAKIRLVTEFCHELRLEIKGE